MVTVPRELELVVDSYLVLFKVSPGRRWLCVHSFHDKKITKKQINTQKTKSVARNSKSVNTFSWYKYHINLFFPGSGSVLCFVSYRHVLFAEQLSSSCVKWILKWNGQMMLMTLSACESFWGILAAQG